MRHTLLLAALVWAGLASAMVPADAPTFDAVGQATPKPADDDDEDAPKPAGPAATPAAGDKTAAPAGTTTTKAPAAAATPAPGEPAPLAATGETMKLVSGAPLYNPNVAVHIVEQKQFSDSGKRELILYPIALQVNGKFTQHYGSMASFVYHLQENFGIQITGGYNWYNTESAFNGELVEKVRAEAQAATSLLWTWGVLGGVEVVPVYGKFSFFEGSLGHFSVVLNGGLGVGGTRHQLKPETTRTDGSTSGASFGDTGLRFMGSLGAGFRLQIGSRFAIRLELRDVVYTARADKVNGCDVNDLRAMDSAQRMGRAPETANVGGGCKKETFTGTNSDTGNKNANDVPLALALVKSPSSDVLSNIGLYLGASFNF